MYQAIHYDDHGPDDRSVPLSAATRSGLSPPALRPYDGVPVGTGDAGGLLYQTAYGLELTVNHADALDYAPDGAMQAWAWEAGGAPDRAGLLRTPEHPLYASNFRLGLSRSV